jgi:glutathione synthase/RimK-type ligase-like ATP-grasp enzyme
MTPKQTASSRHATNSEAGWAPRLAQEARLAELEAALARQAAGSDRVDTEVEHAALLAALNRREESRQAFIAILRRAPTHFSALNQFATLLAETGAIDAACRVYTEAILHHPKNPMARVNLANLLWRTNRHSEARAHYETALEIDPDYAPAHQGLGAVLADIGDRAAAQGHFRRGFRDHAVSTLPYRGTAEPVRLLQLISSGGGNIPTAPFIDDCVFQTTVVVADHLDLRAALPPHQLIFNTIGDADLCQPALEAAIRLIARTNAPVINDPRAVMRSGRIDNARRLGAIAGVKAALTLAFPRDMLKGPDGAASLAGEGFAFPLLLRSPGYHTGRNFVLVETPVDLPEAAASLPSEVLLAIEYLDTRGEDGNARKYRVMMIDGVIYPLHLAISRDWKVHYFTSDMAEQAGHRSEEARFLDDMPSALGPSAMAALERIRNELGLDYAGVDFAVRSDGDLLLFEANATMVIAPPGPDERWAYRRAAIQKILDAAAAMVMARSAPLEK